MEPCLYLQVRLYKNLYIDLCKLSNRNFFHKKMLLCRRNSEYTTYVQILQIQIWVQWYEKATFSSKHRLFWPKTDSKSIYSEERG